MNQVPPKNSHHFYVTGIALSQFILGAEALGIDARTIMKSAGLSEDHLVPTAKVPEVQYEMVLLQLSLAGQSESLGADIGQQLMPSVYGALTSMLLNSPSIADGLANFVNYQALATGNCGGIERSAYDNGAEFNVIMTHSNPVVRRLVAECVITLLCNFLRMMAGKRQLAPESILMEHQPTSERARYHLESSVACPVVWGKGSTRMFIDADTYRLPIHGQGQEMLQMARQVASRQLESLLKRSSSVEAIQWHARELMRSRSPRREMVAERLGISPSTLDRRLKQAELTWQQIVDGIRAQLAVEYLSDPTLTVSSVAEKLGFSDTRAFQRRFKRWTGMTPTEFRNCRIDR